MSLVMDDTDKLKLLFEDATTHAASRSLPPDVNAADYRFEPVDRRSSIRYGLGAVKGTGEARIEAIVAARAQGGAVHAICSTSAGGSTSASSTAACVEALIRAGAFDAIDATPRDAARVGRHRARRGRARRGRAQSRCRCSATSSTRRRRRWSKARDWTEAERLSTRRPRSASISPAICSSATPRSSRRSCAHRSRNLQPRRDRC